METLKQKALIVKTLRQAPALDDFDIPEPKQNQVQIKLIASTINPSDRALVRGGYGKTNPGFVAGLQGYGEITKVGTKDHQGLIGKKVSFTTYFGSWAEYTVASIDNIFQIDSDVPVQSAASGVVNPLTVIGIVDTYKKWNNYGLKPIGLINTAAASALGRMLNKYCQKQNIPLLNIVRRSEQVKLLEEEGAKFIIDTSNQNWLDTYTQMIKTYGFNILFEAIGGGQVTEKLISNLQPNSQVHIYGKLTTQPFIMKKPLVSLSGTSISNFMLFQWYSRIAKEQKQEIKKGYSNLLKNQLATFSLKQIKPQQVTELWGQIQKRATEGKYTIIF